MCIYILYVILYNINCIIYIKLCDFCTRDSLSICTIDDKK